MANPNEYLLYRLEVAEFNVQSAQTVITANEDVHFPFLVLEGDTDAFEVTPEAGKVRVEERQTGLHSGAVLEVNMPASDKQAQVASQEAGPGSIVINSSSGTSFINTAITPRATLYLPAETDPSHQSLRLDIASAAGQVTLRSARFGKGRLEVPSGIVHISDTVVAGKVAVLTKHGHITVENSAAEKWDLHTVTGRLIVKNVLGEIDSTPLAGTALDFRRFGSYRQK